MRTLFFRISLGILVSIVVSLVVAGAIFRYDITEQVEKKITDQLRFSMEMIGHIFETIEPDSLELELEKLEGMFGCPVSLVDPSDKNAPQMMRRPDNTQNSSATIRQGGQLFIYQPLFQGSSLLVVGPLESPPKPSLSLHLILLGAVLLVVTLTGYALVLPVIRKLAILEAVTTSIAEGELSARANLDSPDAIGRLAKMFNNMAESIQSLVAGQRQLLQAASHELRTPAARIRFGIEMLSSAKTSEERQQYLSSVDSDLDELDQLVAQLLDYNRYNTISPGFHQSDILISSVIKEIVAKSKDLQCDANVRILEKTVPDCMIHADRQSFLIVIRNLLQNALRHAQSIVTITIEESGKNLLVRVDDDGPGVPYPERERVFEPFARLDDSRSRTSGGAGLGLAIVHAIIDLHGGSVHVEESGTGGASFVTTWPSGGNS